MEKGLEESGHWLQYMLLLNSGNRIQTVVMVTNYALGTSFNVLCASDEQRPIQLTRRDGAHFIENGGRKDRSN